MWDATAHSAREEQEWGEPPSSPRPDTDLPCSCCLFWIRIGENSIGSDGARQIAKALETNTTLRSLG